MSNPSKDATVPNQTYWASTGYAIGSVRAAAYAVERPNSSIPDFGTAVFMDAKVHYGGAVYTPAMGNADVIQQPFHMYTSVWYGGPYYVPKIAVETYSFSPTGDFGMKRLLPY